MRILAPSIVDTAQHRGGAGTVTRSLVRLLERAPLAASVDRIAARPSRRLHGARQAASLVRSFGSTLPAKAHFTRSRRLRREIERRLSAETYDLLLLCGSDLLWLLDELPPRMPTLLLAYNDEHELYRSQIDGLGLPAVLRAPLMHDYEKLGRYESRGLHRAGHVIFLSRDEETRRRREDPDLVTTSVPPLFDYAHHRRASKPRAQAGLDIGFLGNFEWWPNRLGLDWLLGEVLPHAGPDVTLHVFGQGSERAVRAARGVEVAGFVPQLEDVWSRCDFMVCPIFHGAGVNVKLAESIYNRMPVLASPFATRGLALEPGDSLVTLAGAREWAEFLRSPAARRLATSIVPATVGDRFRAEAYVEVVHSFARRAAAAQPLRESEGRAA